MSDGSYVVTAANYLGMSSGMHETMRALDKADAFCGSRGQGALIKAHTESGLPALTALTGSLFFTCVPREDTAYLHQRADLTAVP